ncbi:MAG: RNA polymerase subunit sigma-24 [Pelodictyon luteolum]|uniref:Sigma-24 (FecI-like) n=2 Tax=Pelodictyon luteolum TaxID=1100 RepID=Q3B3L2_CHLL3|nr:sigma factor-like helix-turn-helix DNA-binding protein [Pelodictyon luteolum]ABB24069.1 sigma-24 (FecI-like) [Pelodictyon luteolum DSM 273]KZK75286.1 MAG: RNA polymerase subunit sigma-24 [Pelodictyon luteolum]
MTTIKKSPIDLLDDIYSLAYWMTGSEKATSELVNMTYVNADMRSEETAILKTFRECYIDRYGQETDFCIDSIDCKPERNLMAVLRQWAADIKLSVLLNEISGLKHAEISEIIGKPVETIRTWLFLGRKLLVSDMLLKVSA